MAGYRGLIFTSEECGLANRPFQHFRLSDLSVRSTQTLFSLRSSFIYLLSAACYILQLHVLCYRNKFHCFLLLIFYFSTLKSNLCSFHMKTFLPSPVCLINTVLVCLITSPVSDTNVISMTLKMCKFIPTCTCSSSASWKTNLVVKDFFSFMLIHISHGIKYQLLKKIYDVINKVYTFKFENLTIFIAFPLPTLETGTKFHIFQFDLAPKRTW